MILVSILPNSYLNINNLLKSLRHRLKSVEKQKTDDYGIRYTKLWIFTVWWVMAFLCSLYLCLMNPSFHYVYGRFTSNIEQFHDILVQGGLYLTLASGFTERGREFQILIMHWIYTTTISELWILSTKRAGCLVW